MKDGVFADREEAGRLLARELGKFAGREGVVVLGLPRGGVPVAAEVAQALRVPLVVVVGRTLGAPGQEDLAIGAIGEGGVRVLNAGVVGSLGLREEDIDRIAVREERELERRVAAYRGGHEALEVTDKTVIVVDDGVATGATMRAGLQALRVPLDVLVVRKLGAPGQEELAIGAIGEGGVRVLNEGVVGSLGLREEEIDRIAVREERELERRVVAYRGEHAALEVAGKTVVVVDDGVATGATMRAGLQALRAMGAAKIVAAAPVGAADSVAGLERDSDEVVVLEVPESFNAVGQWYEHFGQTTDEEVRELLAENRRGYL
jgi:putative phosphoribosyl transferase